ncbi:histone H1-like [Stomoxys calcitrans]|uniref:histone H1-like n=2 Tax=Stomoxys calcitrans TaxID=35570 RepID=UPI0027E2CF72|nr:histone H1-like [Stomoxys calcitrans]
MSDAAVVEATASPVAAVEKKAPKKAAAKAKKPSAAPSHPPTQQMVDAAIKTLKERGGSSLPAIKKYLASTYKVDAVKLAPFIKKYLKSAVASGKLIQTKGKGASGSFKLSPSASKEPKAKSAEKKKKAPAGDKKKKAAAPKKAAGEKKAAAKKPSAAKKTAEKKKTEKAKAKTAKKTGTVKAKPAKTAAKASATKPKAPKAKTTAAKPKKAAAAKKPAAKKTASSALHIPSPPAKETPCVLRKKSIYDPDTPLGLDGLSDGTTQKAALSIKNAASKLPFRLRITSPQRGCLALRSHPTTTSPSSASRTTGSSADTSNPAEGARYKETKEIDEPLLRRNLTAQPSTPSSRRGIKS